MTGNVVLLLPLLVVSPTAPPWALLAVTFGVCAVGWWVVWRKGRGK